MKRFIVVVFMFCLQMAFADDPAPASAQKEIDRRISEAKTVKVPLPKVTKYDSDPKAREVYLDAFTRGYQRAFAGIMSTYCNVKWTYYIAEDAGYSAGQAQSYKDHQEVIEKRISEMAALFDRALKTEQGAAANP
jgi:hypothetical protein